MALVGRRIEGALPVDSVYDAVEQAFTAADYAIAQSAPDAIEALEELSTAADYLQSECHCVEGICGIAPTRRALDTARAVLARYKEPKG